MYVIGYDTLCLCVHMLAFGSGSSMYISMKSRGMRLVFREWSNDVALLKFLHCKLSPSWPMYSIPFPTPYWQHPGMKIDR